MTLPIYKCVKYGIFLLVIYTILKTLPNASLQNKDLVYIMGILTVGFMSLDYINENFSNVKKTEHMSSDNPFDSLDLDIDLSSIDDMIEDDDNNANEQNTNYENAPETIFEQEQHKHSEQNTNYENAPETIFEQEQHKHSELNSEVEAAQMEAAQMEAAQMEAAQMEAAQIEAAQIEAAPEPSYEEPVHVKIAPEPVVPTPAPTDESIYESRPEPIRRQMVNGRNIQIMRERPVQQKNLAPSCNVQQLKDDMDMRFNKLEKKIIDNKEKVVKSVANEPEYAEWNDMKYSNDNPETHQALGSFIDNSWDNQYNIINSKFWKVPQNKPPVCSHTGPATTVVPQGTSGYPVSLKEWHDSSKFTKTRINEKWVADQNQKN